MNGVFTKDLPPAAADEQRPSTIIDNVLFKVFKVISELKGRYVYGHGNLFPQWLQQHGVAHAKDMKFKRHSTSRNDIQFENCAVLILVWDHLLEFLNQLEQANRQVGGLRSQVIDYLGSKY